MWYLVRFVYFYHPRALLITAKILDKGARNQFIAMETIMVSPDKTDAISIPLNHWHSGFRIRIAMSITLSLLWIQSFSLCTCCYFQQNIQVRRNGPEQLVEKNTSITTFYSWQDVFQGLSELYFQFIQMLGKLFALDTSQEGISNAESKKKKKKYRAIKFEQMWIWINYDGKMMFSSEKCELSATYAPYKHSVETSNVLFIVQSQ